VTPLHYLGDLVRELFARIPLPVARAIFLAVPVLLLVWVLRLPREETTPPEGTGRWDANLKVWAAAALVLQIVIYALL
jgi:hypothetical protein